MDIFRADLNQSNTVVPGNLLLAEPLLFDPNFQRTVVLICDHQEEQGSFGLVLNRQAELDPSQVNEHRYLQDNLFIGGPVQQHTLHYIHKFAEVEGAIPLRNGVYWGGDYEQLQEMFSLGRLTPSTCRFFVGYSGWGKKQLKDELKQNSWVIANPPDLSIIFDVEPQDLWKEILHRMGGRYKMLVNYPMDPTLN
jgi:putative transcriptional regulator